MNSIKPENKQEIEALNNTADQMDLINIFRAFHSEAAEHIFFSSAHRITPRKDHG